MSLFMALGNPEEIATLHTGQIRTHSLFGFLFLLLQLALTKIQSVNKIILTIKFIAKCFYIIQLVVSNTTEPTALCTIVWTHEAGH